MVARGPFGHYTLIPNPFWGGILFPLVVLGVALVVPFAERRLTGDRGVHNLADRPRDAPGRTAFGVAFLAWVFLISSSGPRTGSFTLRWCRALKVAEEVEETQERAEEEIRRRVRAPTPAGG